MSVIARGYMRLDTKDEQDENTMNSDSHMVLLSTKFFDASESEMDAVIEHIVLDVDDAMTDAIVDTVDEAIADTADEAIVDAVGDAIIDAVVQNVFEDSKMDVINDRNETDAIEEMTTVTTTVATRRADTETTTTVETTSVSTESHGHKSSLCLATGTFDYALLKDEDELGENSAKPVTSLCTISSESHVTVRLMNDSAEEDARITKPFAGNAQTEFDITKVLKVCEKLSSGSSDKGIQSAGASLLVLLVIVLIGSVLLVAFVIGLAMAGVQWLAIQQENVQK